MTEDKDKTPEPGTEVNGNRAADTEKVPTNQEELTETVTLPESLPEDTEDKEEAAKSAKRSSKNKNRSITGDFLLSIIPEYAEGFQKDFPQGCRVLGTKEGRIAVILNTSLGEVIKWAIANADKGEILKPDSVRNEVKEYFDEASWRYR